MSKSIVKVLLDSQEISLFAAHLLAKIVLESVMVRGRCLIALSGGSTPASLYRLMANSPFYESLPWTSMFFFWGDERCVPPDDPESSYHQAVSTWLGQVPVPQQNIFRARGELGPQAAAVDYARQLKLMAVPEMDWPRFDFFLLGMGADAHTASLFPGSPETSGIATVAVSANYQDRPAQRVSMTPDVINASRHVVFLATGKEKAEALYVTLAGPRQPVKLPAQRIHPGDGDLWWLVDGFAASLLPKELIDHSSEND